MTHLMIPLLGLAALATSLMIARHLGYRLRLKRDSLIVLNHHGRAGVSLSFPLRQDPKTGRRQRHITLMSSRFHSDGTADFSIVHQFRLPSYP